MSCLPIVSDSCDRREQVFRVGAAAPRVFNSKYLFLLYQEFQQLSAAFISYQKGVGSLIPASRQG